jgi:hypothetical protein
MRVIVSVVLAMMVVLSGGCASIPLSTALNLSSMSPRALAQIDPAQVRVKISVPADFEIDVTESHLGLSLTTPSGTRSAAMKLSLLGVAQESRSGGLFKADIPVSTYLLALSSDGARQLQTMQRQVLVQDPTGFEFSVSAPFSKVPANPTEVTLWADLKLSPTEPFMRLINGAKIQFEHSADSS